MFADIKNSLVKQLGFKNISPADSDLIGGYFKKENCNFSDYSFTLAYAWSAPKTIFLKETGGCLIIARALREHIDMLYPPLGLDDPKDLNSSVRECAKMLKKIVSDSGSAHNPKILGFSEEKAAMLAPDESYELKEDLPDYIYERSKIIELAGSKYKNKRENINKFLKTYKNYELEELGPQNLHEASEFLRKWYYSNRPERKIHLSELFDTTSVNHEKNFVWEAYQTGRILKNYNIFGLKGLCIRIYGAVAGFIIGEQTTEDTFTVLIEKVDNGFFGLSQFLFREFLKEKAAGRYVNTSDDSDMPGLRVMKESYHPEFLKKRFFLTLN